MYTYIYIYLYIYIYMQKHLPQSKVLKPRMLSRKRIPPNFAFNLARRIYKYITSTFQEKQTVSMYDV